jgi:CHAD domain-containing protein
VANRSLSELHTNRVNFVSTDPLDFECPPDFEIDALIAELEKKFPLEEEAETCIHRTYYDTFDWRLYAKGWTLDIESSDRGLCLNWHQQDAAGHTLRVDRPPRFVWDFPAGALRSRLEPVLEMRALLPQAQIECRCRRFKWLNRDGKTVVRLRIEENRVFDPDKGQSRALNSRIRVLPVKGYRKPVQRMVKVLANHPGLTPASECQLAAALSALGRRAQDYSSKLAIRLEPRMRSDVAGQIILRHLLAALKANEAGLRKDLDSEFLHDFRVAVRRTRSALGQIKGIFPPTVIDRFPPGFAWLGLITGPTRDLDVYLLNFERYKASLPVSIREDLDPLYDFLKARQKQAHQEMVQALDSPDYRQLIEEWSEFLLTPLPEQPLAPNALVPIGELGDRRIWHIYRRILKQGRAIGAETPAEALHELRKQCKKLRYLMEFFQSLYPKNRIKRLIKILKGLQENLGDHQDFEVQEQTLKAFSREMMGSRSVPSETLLAMGILVQDLDRRRLSARDEFADRFADFASTDHQASFRTLFASHRRKEGL